MESSPASPTRLCSPSPARDALQQRLAEYERGSNSAASMVSRHQPFPVQGLSYPMSWAMSPPSYGYFFPSPFGFYPHFMPAPQPFETPRTMMLSVAELDNESILFDGVFSNYGNPSPKNYEGTSLRIAGEGHVHTPTLVCYW